MEILELIDKLEALIASATRVPPTRRALIDTSRVQELINQMRFSIPQAVKEAEGILKRKEALLNQALMDAKQVRSHAEAEAKALLDENVVMQEAKQRADALVEEAQHRAQRMVERAESEAKTRLLGADQYIQETLYNLEEQISTLLSTVRHGIEVLGREDTEKPA